MTLIFIQDHRRARPNYCYIHLVTRDKTQIMSPKIGPGWGNVNRYQEFTWLQNRFSRTSAELLNRHAAFTAGAIDLTYRLMNDQSRNGITYR